MPDFDFTMAIARTAEWFDRAGHFSGTMPGGIITKEGVPSTARVIVSRYADYSVKGWGNAEPSGEWLITGFDLRERYCVIARDIQRAFSDVVAADVRPVPTYSVTTEGELHTNEEFSGLDGAIEVLGGLPPYSPQFITPAPAGLTPIMLTKHSLIVDGVSVDAGAWDFTIRVTASNGPHVDIPVTAVIGFGAPINLTQEVVSEEPLEFELSWEGMPGATFTLYIDTAWFDQSSLPAPTDILSTSSYSLAGITEAETVFWCVKATYGEYEAISEVSNFVFTGHTDEHWDNVVALLHFEGESGAQEFTDVLGGTFAPEGAGVVLTDAVARFGNTALVLPGNQRLARTHSSYSVAGVVDFTMEGWVYSDLSQAGGVFALSPKNTGTERHGLFISASGALQFRCASTVSNFTINSVDPVITPNTWHHIAVTRSGSIWRIFCDGQLVGEHTNNQSVRSGSATLSIGYIYYGGHLYWKGIIDDFRYTVGIARYIESFTPPSRPFPDRGI